MTPIAERSLRGRLVALTPVLPDDAAAIFLWRNDVAASKLDLPYRPVDWMSYNTWLGEIGRDPTRVLFAIRKLEEPPIVGFASLTGINAIYRSAEMGIRIGQESDRSRGYGRDSASLLLDYAWKSLNLNRVQLDVFAGNERAVRAYRSVGFEHEGTRRRAAYIDGQWLDVAMMGALRPSVEVQQSLEQCPTDRIDWANSVRPPVRAATN